MAVSIVNYREAQIAGGQSGFVEVWGTATWTSTNATGDLPVRLGHIEDISFTFLGAPDSDEVIYVDGTSILSNGVIVPSGATIPIGRTGASPTSGTAFAFRYRGY
jgi:hypothetical protein